jgi:GNAT superfamily N-acetyltransferase
MTSNRFSVRPATVYDSPALSHICLLTGDAGQSAEHLHKIPELLGLVWAEPYVKLPYTFGFVLVDSQHNDAVVGYVLVAYDTPKFEAAQRETWFPPLCDKYQSVDEESLTPADKRYLALLAQPPRSSQPCLEFSPAHMHIDLLPAAQGKGYGRRLVGAVMQKLEELGVRGIWIGLDPRNTNARGFYERLGFKPIEGTEASMGLRLDDWQA